MRSTLLYCLFCVVIVGEGLVQYSIDYGERFIIEEGDGDVDFFSHPKILKLTSAGWFKSAIDCFYGKALLFTVEGGGYSGRYVALTPKVTISIEKQIVTRGWASVVVHLITYRPSSSKRAVYDSNDIGVAVVQHEQFSW